MGEPRGEASPCTFKGAVAVGTWSRVRFKELASGPEESRLVGLLGTSSSLLPTGPSIFIFNHKHSLSPAPGAVLSTRQPQIVALMSLDGRRAMKTQDKKAINIISESAKCLEGDKQR